MSEAEVQVWAQLLEVLVRVARHQPALVRDVLDRPGEALHLARIVDARFALGGQREGGPDLGVLHGALAVGVERHFHLDHPVEVFWVAGGLFGAIAERGEQLLRVELHSFA